MVMGIYATVTFVLNSTQYEEYPLRYLAEDCENFRYGYKGPYPAEVMPGSEASLSAEEREQLRIQCERRVAIERKQHRLEDIRNAVVFSSVGFILFIIHFPQAKKYSEDSK